MHLYRKNFDFLVYMLHVQTNNDNDCSTIQPIVTFFDNCSKLVNPVLPDLSSCNVYHCTIAIRAVNIQKIVNQLRFTQSQFNQFTPTRVKPFFK